MYQKLADAAYTPGRCCVCTHQIAAMASFFGWNDVMAAIVKFWRHMRNLTLPFDAYLLEEQSCQTSPRSQALCFLRGRPKMSSGMRSVPGPKITKGSRRKWITRETNRKRWRNNDLKEPKKDARTCKKMIIHWKLAADVSSYSFCLLYSTVLSCA